MIRKNTVRFRRIRTAFFINPFKSEDRYDIIELKFANMWFVSAVGTRMEGGAAVEKIEKPFRLVSPYQPTGDQPQAIESLVKGFREGNQFQTLLGVTGSGKTFTMANIIQELNRPTLVIAHNKTLAAQLYGEFKEFFPENAVEYFVSYYDYYQPEAYVPSTDTYIE